MIFGKIMLLVGLKNYRREGTVFKLPRSWCVNLGIMRDLLLAKEIFISFKCMEECEPPNLKPHRSRK